ncbi:MAG: ATP-binding protein [Fimbriimonadales bacterium]
MQDWEWIRTQSEGQFFERKSCYEWVGGVPKRRAARDVARDVAETLAAMVNADGGTLALGIEDDGTPTGVDYPPDRSKMLVRKGMVRLLQKRGRVYVINNIPEDVPLEKPTEYALLEPVLARKGFVKNKDIREALYQSAGHSS